MQDVPVLLIALVRKAGSHHIDVKLPILLIVKRTHQSIVRVLLARNRRQDFRSGVQEYYLGAITWSPYQREKVSGKASMSEQLSIIVVNRLRLHLNGDCTICRMEGQQIDAAGRIRRECNDPPAFRQLRGDVEFSEVTLFN